MIFKRSIWKGVYQTKHKYRGVTCFQQSHVSDNFQNLPTFLLISMYNVSSLDILRGNHFVYIFNKNNIRKTFRGCYFLLIHLE